jgi:hypothetical protein
MFAALMIGHIVLSYGRLEPAPRARPLAAIVSGYVRPIRRRGSDKRDRYPIRVMLLIKESANRVPCSRLFFHLSAQIDGSATNS